MGEVGLWKLAGAVPPPKEESPHVLTAPFACNAAKAFQLDAMLTTGEVGLVTVVGRVPESLPHVLTLPSVCRAAKASR